MTEDQLRAAWKRDGCRSCVHFRPDSASCDAFPDGIPIQVIATDVDHFTPLPGDRGVRFEAAKKEP